MPNVTWQGPQVLVDLLAMNLLAARNGMDLPGPKEIVVISPWLSDVEIFMRPGAWHQQLTIGEIESSCTVQSLLADFRTANWDVRVAVLSYGRSRSGLEKNPERFTAERNLLRMLIARGVTVYLLPDLHAKAIVTPLGIVTGSTNLTTSGMFAQLQNANYFPFNHPDFFSNRSHLMSMLEGVKPVESIP
jgi:hypothetical protein